MVAEVTSAPSETEPADTTSTVSQTEAHRWQLVKRFQTLESALALMKQLENRGQTTQLVMADGLSVVTQRV
jgi:hypothetical protein